MERRAICFILSVIIAEVTSEFYEYPVTAIVAPNDSVVFSCASSGTTVMFLNYTSLIDNLDALEKERFSIIYVNISQNRQNVSVMMTASVANYSNNNTYIFCTSQGMTGEIVSLYIAGPPLPPTITMIEELSATSLLVSWSSPFTWINYPVLNYSITVQDSSVDEGEKRFKVDATESNKVFLYTWEELSTTCDKLIFTVTAINAIGESNSSVAIVPCAAFYEHPITAIVAPNDTVVFSCSGSGYTTMLLDNSVITTDYGNGMKDIKSLNKSSDYHTVSLTLVASIHQNNNSHIVCKSEYRTPELPKLPVTTSNKAYLYIAGPPLSPAITELKLLNATSLLIAWAPPFTWLPDYPIHNYNITVHHSVDGGRETVSIAAVDILEYEYAKEDIATSCDELTFTITAINALGESKCSSTAPQVIGLPITPEDFPTPINTSVLFDQQDLSPSAEIEFSLPYVCKYQQANYSVSCTNTVTGDVIQKDSHYSQANASSNVVKISVNSINRDQVYNCVVSVETKAGSVISKTATFTSLGISLDLNSYLCICLFVTLSVAKSSSKASILHLAVPSALGGCTLLLSVLALLILVILYHRKSHGICKASSREPKHLPVMVTNPIYSDETVEPLYEAIDESMVKVCVSRQSSMDSRYQDVPPTLPLMRKEKDNQTAAREKGVDEILKEAHGCKATTADKC